MVTAPNTIVWITGASKGLGAAMAATVPFPGATIVNVSRSEVPGIENVKVDFSDPGQWSRVEDDFTRRLGSFDGKLAVLVANAVYQPQFGFAGELGGDEFRKQVIANAAAPLFVAQAFIRACRPGFESALVMMSSNGAVQHIEGASIYCSAKAGIESWVQTVGRERKQRGHGPWIAAVRPGLMETPGFRGMLASTPDEFPAAAQIAKMVDVRPPSDPARIAKGIWKLIAERAETGALVDLGATT
jgi:NAD(P)-dependent dehydrogenase (short-subunit alcohol dehydrogenase family)